LIAHYIGLILGMGSSNFCESGATGKPIRPAKVL
jgi:hypothetical protein